MYLRCLKLWNFRKFGTPGSSLDLEKPCLTVQFQKGLNVLIGFNDSGKSAIIDAIKLILRTHSQEWIGLEKDDFYSGSVALRIECEIAGMEDDEAKFFLEWLGWEKEGGKDVPFLRLFLEGKIWNDRVLYETKAGMGVDGSQMTSEAKEFLRVTYLKPLRDVTQDLMPRKNSRLSQILKSHEAFKGKEKKHNLLDEFIRFNNSIRNYFDGKDNTGKELEDDLIGKELKSEIDKYLTNLSQKETEFIVSGEELHHILERLELAVKNEVNLGLGSLNLLFISAELLHLNKRNWYGMRLGLVEEIEAHLHPQAQLQEIDVLQKEANVQLILTTHSPNLASKVKLPSLILCDGRSAYPMGKQYTMLKSPDYQFLERFLDVTKSNLFFAKGVIFVEGWTEELLLPIIAQIAGFSLTENGISVVNVGNTSFLRYSRIFQRRRKDECEISIPVAVVTDNDVNPDKEDEIHPKTGKSRLLTQKERKETKYNFGKVKTFVSPHKTLEYCIGLSANLREKLFLAIERAGEELAKDGKPSKRIDPKEWDNLTIGKSEKEVAKDMYYNYIGGGKKISKPMIAQHLVSIIIEQCDTNPDFKSQLVADSQLQYLIDAIRYASSGNR